MKTSKEVVSVLNCTRRREGERVKSHFPVLFLQTNPSVFNQTLFSTYYHVTTVSTDTGVMVNRMAWTWTQVFIRRDHTIMLSKKKKMNLVLWAGAALSQLTHCLAWRVQWVSDCTLLTKCPWSAHLKQLNARLMGSMPSRQQTR